MQGSMTQNMYQGAQMQQMQPAQQMQPMQQMQPAQPMQQMQPAQPMQQMQPAQPMQPMYVMQPVQLVQQPQPSQSLSEKAKSFAKDHYLLTGLVVIGIIILVWILWAWYVRVVPSKVVLSRLYEWPGWTIEGTSPSIELVPLRITPNSIDYDIFQGGKMDHRMKSTITYLPDGILLSSGLHLRPLGDELEIAVKPDGRFYPLHKAKAPSIMTEQDR